MLKRIFRHTLMVLFLVMGPAAAVAGSTVAAEAQQGLKEILELWRMEDYERLFSRLEHPPGQGWNYFAERIVYASRIPACCWEMLQDVKSSAVGPDHVVINARVGMEVEGVGTRFVIRDFRLHRSGGIWKLPQQVILDLADYNMQRVPRKVYERQL